MRNAFSQILIYLGVGCLLFGSALLYQHYTPSRLAFNTVPESKNVNALRGIDSPKKLQIEARDINQQIYPAEVLANKWQISNYGVSFLTNSVIPGERGNSIMYGHNWTSILGNLKKVKGGDEIKVTFDSGVEKKFVVEYVFEVNPSQVDILAQTDTARLTIYTCSGFLDSKRLVVVAVPETINS